MIEAMGGARMPVFTGGRRTTDERKKNRMKKKRYTAILTIALAAALLASGCSNNGADESKEGSAGTNSSAENSITYKTDGGKEITLSSEKEVPEGFPGDIPLPGEIGVTSSLKSEASGNITVSIETEMPFEEVVKLYQEYADSAGYKENFKINEEGFYSFSGAKDSEQFVFTLQLDLDNNKTVTGALVYEKKP